MDVSAPITRNPLPWSSFRGSVPRRAAILYDRAGSFDLPGERGVRLWRALSYYKDSAENAYARPIEGVVAYVDMDTHRVMRLVDAGVAPVHGGLRGPGAGAAHPI